MGLPPEHLRPSIDRGSHLRRTAREARTGLSFTQAQCRAQRLSINNNLGDPTMNQSVKQSVKEYILKTFLPNEDPNELTDDLPLISGGILDSITTLKLIMYLE